MKLKLAALIFVFSTFQVMAQDKPKEPEQPKPLEQNMCFTERTVQEVASLIAQQQKIIIDLRQQLADRKIEQSGMFAK